MCGGTDCRAAMMVRSTGLSPRVRGNPVGPFSQFAQHRSIPACAGEPGFRTELLVTVGVYPRVCGGTLRQVSEQAAHSGLSPRVRGNQVFGGGNAYIAGSIPACAGEPWRCQIVAWSLEVYPRVCGGTTAWQWKPGCHRGLSPRVRGNLPPPRLEHPQARSIPACAGEPIGRSRPVCRRKVYPRVCGGTPAFRPQVTDFEGLSPRVRGNPVRFLAKGKRLRSIPACAGEPHRRCAASLPARVYPRVCGGTSHSQSLPSINDGLSPRVRGNLRLKPARNGGGGSIPACAGEPGRARLSATPRKVYPRVCGGTRMAVPEKINQRGLSPRVRGNLWRQVDAAFRAGSIPACAGEPVQPRRLATHLRVYPRVCGGTRGRRGRRILYGGLSPRVRGNPLPGFPIPSGLRSIPACAGEPTTPPPSAE